MKKRYIILLNILEISLVIQTCMKIIRKKHLTIQNSELNTPLNKEEIEKAITSL